ncbi:Hypothetical protein FKW44_000655 [Caligus rogercresseyi]|uniref:Uncharacterized protein n=1 Tax=Caligus rogercresseyi TaxID=217165 RepID=A0A7T8KHP5_CALRO|nr:Hypothetical protein FKW44_000655 [Caligus rogercresseyi]
MSRYLCAERIVPCDRVYDCVNRRDEDHCDFSPSFNSSNGSSDIRVFGLNAFQWTLSILAVGIPVVLLIYVGLRRLILLYGVLPPVESEESSIGSEEASPVTEDSLDLLKALDAALDADQVDKEELIRLHADIHDSPFWLQNLRAFFEIINLIADRDEYKIVAFCSILRDLELSYHDGNVLHMDLCLKDNLGYHFSALFYWNAEPPPIRNFYLKCTPLKCFSLIRRCV